MNKVLKLWDRAVGMARRISDLGPLLMRVALGAVFIPTGWGKLQNLDGVTEFFTNLGIPAPGFHAVLVGNIELVGGACILLGLATRLWAIALSGTMVVAIFTAMLEDVEGIADFFALNEFVYITMFVLLIVRGAGGLSIDHLVARKLHSAPQAVAPARGT